MKYSIRDKNVAVWNRILVAETSVTIDGVRFVIDSGLIKQREFNPETGIDALAERRHAQSGCTQRAGRAGRTAPGTCYRLYTEDDHKARKAFQTPEIMRSNLDHVILAMKNAGIFDVRGFPFIDRPQEAAIANAVKTLKALGALDTNEKLTTIGERMADIPLKPELARMVIEGEKYGCMGSVCTIAAMMGEKPIFVRPKGKEYEADNAHQAFKHGGSDFLTLLEVWKQWSASGFSDNWARERFINVRQLFEAREVRFQLMRELRQQNGNAADTTTDDVAIQKSIAAGLIQRLMIGGRHSSYRGVAMGESNISGVFIHPGSAAFSASPEYMIGSDVMTTSKTYARRCQPVDPSWLPEIAPQLLEERGSAYVYDNNGDQMMRRSQYGLKSDPYRVITEKNNPITDRAVCEREFMNAVIAGSIDAPFVRVNNEALRTLKMLYARSGGSIPLPDMGAWYRERMQGIASRNDADAVGAHLRLDIADYCPPETKADLDARFPESITVKGHALTITYKYRPANVSAYYESEKKELFKATIALSPDAVFALQANDLPVIGTQGRPEIAYRCGDSYSSASNASLDVLKEAVDKKRHEDAWYKFKQPKTPEVTAIPLQPLPSFESLGVGPVPYTKDFRGTDVMAFPSYRTQETYDYTRHTYQYKFSIMYYRTSEEAARNNTEATQYKEREDAAERRRQERVMLLAPAGELQADLKQTMSSLSENYASYGLSEYEYYDLDRQWREAERALSGQDTDPKRAIDILDKIKTELTTRHAGRERRIALIPIVQQRMEAMKAQIQKITYDNYTRLGLTYDQYSAISNKWRDANDLIQMQDNYGRQNVLDPEKATLFLDEIIALLPQEQYLTQEQEQLIGVLSGRNAGYAQIIRVQDGRVTEYFSPSNSGSPGIENPKEIPIGGSGRHLRVNGARLTFIMGSGRSSGNVWDLPNGDFLFSRDASVVLQVQQEQKAPYGWRAMTAVYPQSQYDEAAERHVAIPSQPVPRSSSLPQQGEGSPVFGRLSEELKAKEATVPPSSMAPSTPPVHRTEVIKPAERAVMTEEVRQELKTIMAHGLICIDSVRAVLSPEKKNPNADKMLKLKAREKEFRTQFLRFNEELETIADASRARGKVGELVRSAERIAQEMARLLGIREDWPQRYRTWMNKLAEIAAAEKTVLTPEMKAKIHPKLMELARSRGEPTDVEGALFGFIVDSS